MKTIYSSILLFLLAFVQVNAQTYQRVYSGDMSYYQCDVAWSEYDQTYISVSIPYSTGNIQVIKTTATGVPVWQMSYALGVPASSEPDVVVSSEGTIFIGGATDQNTAQYYVLTLFSWGQVWWGKMYVGAPVLTYGNPSLRILPDGNLMLTESTVGHVGFIKMNPAGTVISSNIYRDDPNTEGKTPGFASDVFPDGSMIFTGKRDCDIMIVKTDASGQMQWSRVMNVPAASQDSFAGSYYHTKDILALSDGSSLACGYDNMDGFVMRLDANGSIMWYKRLAPTNLFSGSCFYDIERFDANTFVLSGVTDCPVLAKIDLNGNLLSSVELRDSTFTLNSMNVTMNPGGQIAWPVSMYDPMWSQLGMSLHIMDDVAPTGCNMSQGSLSFMQSGVETPLPLNMPIYTIPQPITESVLSATGTPLTITYSDWCSVVAVEEPASDETQLTIRNSVLDQTTPLYFSLGEHVGEITYTVHDMNGNVITNASEDMDAGEVVSSNTQVFAAGMYVLTVQAGEKVFAEKFVVRE